MKNAYVSHQGDQVGSKEVEIVQISTAASSRAPSREIWVFPIPGEEALNFSKGKDGPRNLKRVGNREFSGKDDGRDFFPNLFFPF